MNTKELEEALKSEGCNSANYAINLCDAASDVFCLTERSGKWCVFYTERGIDHSPIFSSESEFEACNFFYNHIMSHEQNHCVGFFISESNAFEFQAELNKNKILSKSDAIPYGGAHDLRYRVFVYGKAIFQVKTIFINIPVKD